MKTRRIRPPAGLCLFLLCIAWPALMQSQDSIQFTRVQRLTNNEVALTLNAPFGDNYRIDAASTPSNWNGLVNLPVSATTSLQHTDSAAPYLDARFYRARQLTETNVLSGDILSTTNDEVVIQPRYHASFVLQWNGKMIYSDPAPPATFTGVPKADLILVTHSHGDHFNTSTINSVTNTNCVIIVPQAVYAGLTTAQKSSAVVLTYLDSTNVMGLNVQAVAGYNPAYHPYSNNNCYLLTIGGKRIFISGDTGDVPEIRALTDIDVAFVCMNQPFTMTVNAATNCVRAMRPKVVYPYHYRDQSGTTTNAATFKRWLGADLGIEVRLRKWY